MASGLCIRLRKRNIFLLLFRVALQEDETRPSRVRLGLPPAPLYPAGSPSPTCLRPSSAYPGPEDSQEQEHTSQRGVDPHAWAQCTAPTAPASTASLHGRGEGRRGIEEHSAVAVVLHKRINIGEVV